MSGSRHPNATGYLDDLATEVNQSWFNVLRNIAVIKNTSLLESEMLENICSAILGETEQIPEITPPTTIASTPQPIITYDYLEQLSAFSNFKLLSDTLTMKFNKQITLIFGANGSGKSSICESLKVLSNPDAPRRSLKNLRAPSRLPSSFAYKLRSNATDTVWTSTSGYGVHSDKIKYFDSTIASHNVSVAVEPGRVVSLTPFRLGIFESIRELTVQVRKTLRQKQSINRIELIQMLSELNADFQDFDFSPLKAVDIKTCNVLSDEIIKAESYDQQDKLLELLKKENDLKKATSDAGLKALRLEQRELETITYELKLIKECATSIWSINPAEKVKTREFKKTEQRTLAERLIPDGSTLEKLLTLIKSASVICKLNQADGEVCPLCRRTLEEEQIDLFKQYHEIVNSQLEVDIGALSLAIEEADKQIKIIKTINISAWDKLTTIDPDFLESIKTNIRTVVDACGIEIESSAEVNGTLSVISKHICMNNGLLESKQQAIETSENGRDAVLKDLEGLRKQIQPLVYQESLTRNINKLRKAEQLNMKAKAFVDALSGFTVLLTKITNVSKVAYEYLVVSDFETRLNQEYNSLTEEDMSSFGVTLKRSGSDATVTVSPQVGGKGIDKVLSEGELHMHSLALFFAELECFCCPILVFDDPISSFDYNYIENFCIRLRDFALAHTNCQIITLTHNWEFFVQLQNKLNSGGLNNKLSVQVLESCCTVAEYTEKVNELKIDINAILTLSNEPSKAQKEEMAGKMRRLIETVVNTHVFNGQRHQYKQKSQSISVFQKYINVIPLTQDEATKFTDLYSKLSISEHDDPRNAYVNTNKATFQTRFNRITAIETAIVSRK